MSILPYFTHKRVNRSTFMMMISLMHKKEAINVRVIKIQRKIDHICHICSSASNEKVTAITQETKKRLKN